MKQRTAATLILEDGSRFDGYSFGYEGSKSGEVVFNTAMTGYTEALTDPSFMGQIMVMTYPSVGNYGVPPRKLSPFGVLEFMESPHIHVQALIVSDYSESYSHWNAEKSLAEWLVEEQVPAITGIDTRALAKHLREAGTMRGVVHIDGQPDASIEDEFQDRNLVAEASCTDLITYGSGPKKVVLLDCGLKNNIIRRLIDDRTTVIRVPWDYNFHQIDYDGLFISNGPGDPNMCDVTVKHIQEAFAKERPVCGICMGNQLISRAAGAAIFKLKHGHRSHNQPVQLVGTNRCFITSQNHGFAIDPKTLDNDWEELFINLNDGTNEGIRHKHKPFSSVQFHPEACGGPTDTYFIFEDFLKQL